MLCTGSDESGSDATVWFGNSGTDTGVDGDQNSNNQEVQKKLPSGSLYNERGRNELVEIGARYEDRHVNNGEKEDTVVDDHQKGRLDFDEYDDDGGDAEVEKKAEATDGNEDSRRTQRLRGSVQTDAGGMEELPVLDKLGEQNSRITIEVQLNQDTVAADAKGHKPPRTKKKRHSASAYIIANLCTPQYIHIYITFHQFSSVVITPSFGSHSPSSQCKPNELLGSLQLHISVFGSHQCSWLLTTYFVRSV